MFCMEPFDCKYFIPADKTVEIGVKSSGGGQRQEA